MYNTTMKIWEYSVLTLMHNTTRGIRKCSVLTLMHNRTRRIWECSVLTHMYNTTMKIWEYSLFKTIPAQNFSNETRILVTIDNLHATNNINYALNFALSKNI